jgi:hypothetical protein
MADLAVLLDHEDVMGALRETERGRAAGGTPTDDKDIDLFHSPRKLPR